MAQIQRTTLWLAALFACAGTACIAVYLLTRKPEGYLLFGAAVAAVFSATALVVGVIFVCVESTWRIRPTSARFFARRPDPVVGSSLSAQFQQRQEVLSERFNIDEPHFCSKAQAPCVSWSFCGSAPDTPPITSARSRNGQPLPLIKRSGAVVSCLALAPVAETGKLSHSSDLQEKSA